MFAPALQALAAGPCRFATLRQLSAYAGQPGLLNQVLQMLAWAGLAHPCRPRPHAVAPPLPMPPGLALRMDAGTACAASP